MRLSRQTSKMLMLILGIVILLIGLILSWRLIIQIIGLILVLIAILLIASALPALSRKF